MVRKVSMGVNEAIFGYAMKAHRVGTGNTPLLTFIVRAHQAWCSHLKWAWAECTRGGALRPFKFSVPSRRGLEL